MDAAHGPDPKVREKHLEGEDEVPLEPGRRFAGESHPAGSQFEEAGREGYGTRRWELVVLSVPATFP